MVLESGKKFVRDGEKQRLLLEEHTEKHFTSGEVVRDIIIGVSDGLTVPFALAAGLSGANAPSALVLTAGLAEVAAGAISMGLGGHSRTKQFSAAVTCRPSSRAPPPPTSSPSLAATAVGSTIAIPAS